MQKDTKAKFSFLSTSTKKEKEWEFWRSKGNTELLLLSPSANSAQTGGFPEKAWAEEIKERDIEKIVRDEIVNFLKVNQELKMYMIYNSKLEREQL